MNLLFTLLFCVLTLPAFAQEIYPKGCTPWPINQAIPSIKATQPTLLMLHNLTEHDLWITQPITGQGMQAGFSSLISTGQWSALALSKDKTKLSIKCIESKPGHEQEIACSEALAICQWPKTEFPKAKSGIFWAGENMSLAPLLAFLARQGYVLH